MCLDRSIAFSLMWPRPDATTRARCRIQCRNGPTGRLTDCQVARPAPRRPASREPQRCGTGTGVCHCHWVIRDLKPTDQLAFTKEPVDPWPTARGAYPINDVPMLSDRPAG